MPSERIQRRIDSLLDLADNAVGLKDWATVAENAKAVLALEPANADAQAYLAASERGLGSSVSTPQDAATTPGARSAPLPASFFAGRYRVLRLLGEGGKKRVYLARDERLQRDVALAVIPAGGLDGTGRERILREAQHMGRVGAHPNLVTVHDIGEEDGNPCIVQEFIGGGDVASLLEQGKLPVARTLRIAADVLQALSFMHGQGVVHRDLKPANVFLATDGTAKVGDFGLAVSTDFSRLTLHGTLVGTVAYMPPEQAIGGDVTPRSDLYSLGAMLYEMITGRTPFLGDDATAIISQHLNTAPVAPSWHTQDCPPLLEALILRLLEKDPAKRPASADEVAAALAAINPDEKSSRHAGGNPLAGLARGVFVGREKELERLKKAFDEAFAGRGSLVMLVGEPGIGKTRAAQELETYARMRGAQVLWGRSHESSGAPPYWPWVQAGRQWGAANDLASIQAEVAPVRGELVRLFPELREQPGFVEPETLADPQSAQFQLFDAFATFVRAIAGKGPLVIALDDLHWADKPTLLLLQHVARDLGRSRLLIVCTYRDTDLSRAHPLSEALGALNRDPGFQRVVLRGLSKDEVRAYIREAAHAEPKTAVLEKIFEETEGNPFFLSEVVNLLTQEGTLNRESVSDIAVPDGVKEALGRRLDRVSKEANALLQVAAIVGREFAYETLSLLGERDGDVLLHLIEEGIEARVIEEMAQPGHYRFTHALMQETLLSELSTTRRLRLHGQVGEALERRWSDRAAEYASRLATHFNESATLTPEHGEKAYRYSKLAAEQAEAQFAWPEAAALYGRCVELHRQSRGTIDADIGPVLTNLARDGWNAGVAESIRYALEAMDLYRERGDGPGFARAAIVALDNPSIYDTQQYVDIVEEALALLGDADVQLEGRLLSLLVDDRVDHDPYGDADDALIARAAGLADEHDIARLKGALCGVAASRARARGDFAGARRESYASYVEYDRAGDFFMASGALSHMGRAQAAEGDLEAALAASEQALEYARLHRAPYSEAITLLYIGRIAILRNDARLLARVAAETAVEHPFAVVATTWAAELRGEASRILDATRASVQQALESGFLSGFRAVWEGTLARGLLHSGHEAEAAEWLARWAESYGRVDGWDPAYSLACLAPADDALVRLGTGAMWRQAYARLIALSAYRVEGPIGLDHLRGDLALKLEKPDEAARWYETGLAWATRERVPVEAGRCLQGLAALAELRGDVSGALAQLDRAAELFRDCGARLYLDPVIAAKVRLQGITSDDTGSSIDRVSGSVRSARPEISVHAAADGTVTLMFSDIEGSTVLNEQMGDTKWMEVLRAHNAVVEAQVKAHGGHVVKSMGDGFMVVFASAESGVRCALAIQAVLSELRTQNSELAEGIRVRIGVHVGRAVRDNGDFFGREVNYAARVAGTALGGEVVVSEAVRERLERGSGFVLAGRPAELKGFAGEQHVFTVRASQASGHPLP